MQTERDIQLLQLTYAAVLADTVSQMAQESILEKVTQRKKAEQAATGKMKAEHFGIASPEAVFTRFTEIFDCASWEIRKTKKKDLLLKPKRVSCVPLPRKQIPLRLVICIVLIQWKVWSKV